jgi:hypothetical protein
MATNISLLCPSRERVRKLSHECYPSILETAHNPENIELLVYIDEDDKQRQEYVEWSSSVPGPVHVEIIVGPTISVSRSWNTLAKESLGDVLYMWNDDLICQTPGWDEKVREIHDTSLDKIYCGYFNDGINHGVHCAFPFVSRKWYETIGWFSPGVYQFGYNDTEIFDIARRINRTIYIPEFLIAHNHWTVTKEKDATTKRHREDTNGQRFKQDGALYAARAPIRQILADKLKKNMIV